MKDVYLLENFCTHWEEIRDLLYSQANMIRLTNSPWIQIGFLFVKKCGTEKDQRFQKLLDRYIKSFLKKTTSNEKFNHVAQGRYARFDHYYFKLSDELKQSLSKAKLMVWNYNPDFYGFEDVNFYNNNELICTIISHENMAILNLNKSEANTLASAGLPIHKMPS